MRTMRRLSIDCDRKHRPRPNRLSRELGDPRGTGLEPGRDRLRRGEVSRAERLRRPDRDRRWACLAYEVPGPDDLPIFLDRQTADAIERHALRDTSVELGGILLGKECVDEETRAAVRLGHQVARGQALREHPGELHLHPRLLGGDHPRARPALSRPRHRRLVPHASRLRHLPLQPRSVHPSQFLRPAAPGGLRGRPDPADPRVLPVAQRRLWTRSAATT